MLLVEYVVVVIVVSEVLCQVTETPVTATQAFIALCVPSKTYALTAREVPSKFHLDYAI